MDLDEAREFLRANHRAILVTRRSDGRLQTSPVLAAVDGEGRVVVSTTEATAKTRNLARDARASVCAISDSFYGPWAQIDGEVEIVRQPEAVDVLVDYYRRVSGEHPDWDDYRAALKRDGRVALRLTITSAGPDSRG